MWNNKSSTSEAFMSSGASKRGKKGKGGRGK